MKLVTGSEMRGLDQRAREEYGISELVLMENAGRQVAEAAQKWLEKSRRDRVLILAGSGNNGGDGLVAARYLLNAGRQVRVLFLSSMEKLGNSCRVQLTALQKMGLVFHVLQEAESWPLVKEWLQTTDLVIDGIYGTGFHGELPAPVARLVEWIRQMRLYVLAIDIPSGVEADTGTVCGTAVYADQTVTLALPKPGLFLGTGAKHAGKVRVKEIGMPFPLLQDENLGWNFTERREVQCWLPKRQPDSHKGTYGHAVVIGGSKGMAGAVRMASRAALCTGAGCVTAVMPSSVQAVVQVTEMEVMTRAVSETPEQQFSAAAAAEILAFLQADERKNALVLGPGMGRYPQAGEFVRSVLGAVEKPVVVDADGLMALAGQTEVLRKVKAPLIVTPHPGEMAALTGLSVAEIESRRIETVIHYAKTWQVIVVLKGHHTLIASPDGQLWMNSTGNAGMSTAGSGDVLSGIIAGLLAQGVAPFRAAVAGVYIHGAAGDKMAKKVGQHGLVAGDLLKGIPKAMQDLSK